MMELFPWEEAEPAQARVETEREEPVEIEPERQPDGDPREMEETGEAVVDPQRGEEGDASEAHEAERRPLPETQTPRHGDPLRPQVRERIVARKEYYSIGEVSDLVGLPAHVLRYWESQFAVLNPSKNRSGNRAYQRKEIRLILLVKHLLYEEKYTVDGAKAKLDQLRRGGGVQERAAMALDRQTVALLRDDLAALRRITAPAQ